MTITAWIVVAVVFVFGIVLGAIATKRRQFHFRRRQLDEARVLFQGMREQLEAKFLQRAALSGKPRGLRWADCEFEHDVAYARDRQTGQLCAWWPSRSNSKPSPAAEWKKWKRSITRNSAPRFFITIPSTNGFPTAGPFSISTPAKRCSAFTIRWSRSGRMTDDER